jgi:hypothetical protein
MSAHLDGVLSRLQNVQRNGTGWKALCPAHADKNPSLSIRERDGKMLLKCFAGCSFEAICAALGMKLKDLFAQPVPKPKIVAEYSYTDEQGSLLYQNVRFNPKDFRLRKPNGKRGWTWKMEGVRRVLYRLPEVLAASDSLFVEGEKDADTGTTLGFVATTSGSTGSWRPEFAETLRGKRVTIIADADTPGRKHAQQVARSLSGKADP